MSRYSDDYEEDWPNAGAMYWANVQRATRGKTGRPILVELIAALDAMPVKELHEGYLAHPGTGARCAVGALVVHRLQAQGLTEQEALLKASGDACECSWGGTHTLAQHNEDGCTAVIRWWSDDPGRPCECKAWQPVHVDASESVETAEQLLPSLAPAKGMKGPHAVLSEAMWENDEGFMWEGRRPADRWKHIRAWAVRALGYDPAQDRADATQV